MPAIGGHEHDVLATAEGWRKAGRRFALATVVETWGSAPRPVGSHLIVDIDGNFEGSVSGGCVEGAVIAEAEDVIRDGGARLLSFGVADETAWNVGLSCGGRISVLLQAMNDDPESAATLLQPLNAARKARRPVMLVSDIATGLSRLIDMGHGIDGGNETHLANLAAGVSGIVESPVGREMTTAYLPARRLVLLGAVHISQALAPMAATAGFDVVVIDPRTAFATEERFAGIRFFPEWPQDVLPDLGLDPFTAFAALTHDPKIDDPGLTAALGADCFYVGALGSRKTHGRRLERLRAAGIGERALARIRAPIGLPLGSKSPAEIAVSILAEIIQTKYTADRSEEVAA